MGKEGFAVKIGPYAYGEVDESLHLYWIFRSSRSYSYDFVSQENLNDDV